MENYQLSGKEATALMINLLCSKLFLLAPGYFIDNAGSGALLTVIFVYAVAFAFFGIYSSKTKRDILSLIPSNFFKGLFGALSVLLLVFSGAGTFSQLVHYIKIMAMPKSPIAFLVIPFAAAMVLCAYAGLKSVGKVHGFFAPILFSVLLVLVLLSVQSFEFTNLFPIFGKGVRAVFAEGFFLLSSLFELLVLLYLPSLTSASFRKIGFSALSVSLFFFVLLIGAYLLIDGKTQNLPIFSVIRASALSRTDSLFLLLYALSGMLYLSAVLYFCAYIFGKTFGLATFKPLILPFALILISFSEITFLNPEGQIFLRYTSYFLWILPFLIPLIITWIKPKNKKFGRNGKRDEA